MPEQTYRARSGRARVPERTSRSAGDLRRGYVVTEIDGWLALRSEPDLRGQRILKIPDGTYIDLRGCRQTQADGGRWCQSEYRGRSGWVYDLYVETGRARPSGASRGAARSRPSSNLVILGAYLPSDDHGLQARADRARRTGYSIRIAPSREQGIEGPYTLIFLGPFEMDRAEAVLQNVRVLVPDAYIKSL